MRGVPRTHVEGKGKHEGVSSLHVGPGDRTQAASLGGKSLYWQTHLTSPPPYLFVTGLSLA